MSTAVNIDVDPYSEICSRTRCVLVLGPRKGYRSTFCYSRFTQDEVAADCIRLKVECSLEPACKWQRKENVCYCRELNSSITDHG